LSTGMPASVVVGSLCGVAIVVAPSASAPAVSGTNALPPRAPPWSPLPLVCAANPAAPEVVRAARHRLAGLGVIEVLRLDKTLADQRLNGVGSTGEGEGELLALSRREVLEHERGRIHPAGRTADAKPHPVVVAGAERRGDGTQAVVPVVAAAELQPHRVKGDVELVVDHHHPFGPDLVKPGERGHRST